MGEFNQMEERYRRFMRRTGETGEVYRNLLFPQAQHDDFLRRREEGEYVPNRGWVLTPITDENTIPESQRHRLDSGYFATIFSSFISNSGNRMPYFHPGVGASFPFPTYANSTGAQFIHDLLLYEAKIELLSFTRQSGRNDLVAQIHLPCDGKLIRAHIPGETGTLVNCHNADSWALLGNGHDIPNSFGSFAAAWFQLTPTSPPMRSIYYFHSVVNRLDLHFYVDVTPNVRQYLKITFEPGWPIQPFDEDAWADNNPVYTHQFNTV